MNITLMAHDKKKELMVQFLHGLQEHFVQAQPVCHRHHRPSHRRGHRSAGLLFLSSHQGGHQQVDVRIAYNEIDMVLLFSDPNGNDPWEDQRVMQTIHLCDS